MSVAGLKGGGGITFSVETYRATRNNELVDDISDYVQKGKVNYNADRRIRRGGSIEVRGQRLVPYRDYVAPFIVLDYDDGRPQVRRQAGLYTLRAPAGARNRELVIQQFALNDLTYELDRRKLSSPYTVPANALYSDHITALIQAGGFTRINVPSRPYRTSEAKTFPAGSNRLDILNEGLQVVGCYVLSSNYQGEISSDVVLPLASVEPIMVITNADISGDVTSQPTDRDPINVVVLTVERTDSTPLISIARNDELDSPTSTVNLPGESVRDEKITDVASQAVLDAMAASLLSEGRSFYETAKTKLLPNPFFGEHDTVDFLFDGELQYFNGRWWVRTWEMGLAIADPTLAIECNRITDDWAGVLI